MLIMAKSLGYIFKFKLTLFYRAFQSFNLLCKKAVVLSTLV